MFIDYTRIKVTAGNGGHGIVAFRREKHVPKGGPSGGDGGHGGDVIMRVNPHLNTLQDVQYHRSYKAGRGRHGSGNNKNGADGDDVVIMVPVGTLVRDMLSNTILVDLDAENTEFVVAKGGAGGLGNARFKNSRNQSPHEATDGKQGEGLDLELELKVLSDVGLVGFPNAGKSTLLSRLSAAHPKIADYPFTTLEPHLGIVKCGEYNSFVLADIPGIIEGASAGKGLGIQFLKHIERTRLILYLVDASTGESILDQFNILQSELREYSSELAMRGSLLVLTKQDAWMDEPDLNLLQKRSGLSVLPVSAVSGTGLDDLVYRVWHELSALEPESAK